MIPATTIIMADLPLTMVAQLQIMKVQIRTPMIIKIQILMITTITMEGLHRIMEVIRPILAKQVDLR